MTLKLWEPMMVDRRFRDMMDRLFEEGTAATRQWTLPVDIQESEDALRLRAYAPGASKESFEVHYQDDVLTIKVELPEEQLAEGTRWMLREHRPGSYQRAFRLRIPVDVEKATAEYRDGVLHLALPKAESARPRTIQVS